MSRFEESFLDQVRDASDLVSVVDARVPLKKAGKEYVACCPFHSEKSPSFTVSPTKQFYHCFGCGAHGDVFKWRMEYEGMDFVDAVKTQAQSVGIAIPEPRYDGAAKQRQEHVERLQSIVAAARKRFADLLRTNAGAIDYLKRRGVSGASAKLFQLGYAEPGIASAVPDATIKELEDAGLVSLEEGGEVKDRFRYRLMFPVHNERGVVIGFGGRTLQDGVKPKYLNSPEGPLFDKGSELYGLYQAKQAIRNDRTVVLLEGYMDVIMLHQYGEQRAVAALGTSLTERQAKKLFRLADELVFCFDGDQAGQKAAVRALHLVLPELQDGKQVKFLMLPPEHDPDSFVREFGLDGWRQALQEKSLPLSEMLIKSVVGARSLAVPEHVAAVAQEMTSAISTIVSAPIFRAALQSSAEHLLGVKLQVRYTPPKPVPTAPGRPAPSAVDDVDEAVRPVPGKFIFYENLATWCGLNPEGVPEIPKSQMDDFGELIVSWFAIAPKTGRERFESVTNVRSPALRKVLTAAIDRVEQKRLMLSPEAMEREKAGLVQAMIRVAEQEAMRASAGQLFE